MSPESIEALRPFFDALTDGICVADAEGRLLYANRAACALLGTTGAERDGRTVCELLCGRLERGGETRADAAATCPLRLPGDLRDHVTFTGRYRSAAASARGGSFSAEGRDLRVRCLRARLGRAERHFLVIEDVTDEAELARHQEDWRHMLAHDLRIPLTNVLGVLRVLEDLPDGHPLGGSDLEMVRLGVRACRRMQELVDAFLEVARLEAGGMPVHTAPLDVGRLARECAAEQGEAAHAHGLKLRVCAPASGPTAVADGELLRRALLNVLDNALKFTPQGGSVAIEAEGVGDLVELRVRDTGPGIPSAELPRIFDRYYQAEGGRVHGHAVGLGLGLAFCRAAMRAMGGDVAAASEVGHGSVFTLKLPRAPVAAAAAG